MDLFGTGIQIPDLTSGSARPADLPGFIRVFSRNQRLYGVDDNNVEHELSGSGSGQQNVFFQIGGATVLVPAGSDVSQPFLVYKIDGDIVTPYIWEPEIV